MICIVLRAAHYFLFYFHRRFTSFYYFPSFYFIFIVTKRPVATSIFFLLFLDHCQIFHDLFYIVFEIHFFTPLYGQIVHLHVTLVIF